MNRRKLLTFIGLAPLFPFAAKADGWGPMPQLTPVSEPLPGLVSFGAFVPGKSGYQVFAATETAMYQLKAGKWLVCENHHDKAWPDECDCGPGMRYGDTLKS